jgi:redox-sensitive bicupin YhaK (pirin superfamily)
MRTRTDWLDSRHSFSYGPHYDPSNTHFGLLMAHNEDRLRAGTGFDMHAHKDMEILTWVLSGSLAHEDSRGHRGVIRPGLAQRMSAGTGIRHSERNEAWAVDPSYPRHDEDAHYVQMWVLPGPADVAPGYEQRDVTGPLEAGEPVVVASGMARHAADRAITIAQENAALHAARLRPGAGTALPSAAMAHLFVPRGTVDVEGAGTLYTGDSARVSGSDGQRLTAGPDGAEILVWEMDAALG